MNSLKLAAFVLLAAVSWGQTTPAMPTFYARRDYQEPGATQVQVGDTNKDGIPDIVINDHSIINVMLGNGDGTFRQAPNSTTALTGGAMVLP